MSIKAGREWLAPAIVAAVTLLTFLPGVLQNDFVAWDDDRDLVFNPHFRGLGLTQLRWMFSFRSDIKNHYTVDLDKPRARLRDLGRAESSWLTPNQPLAPYRQRGDFLFHLPSAADMALPSNDDWRLTIGATFGALLWGGVSSFG